MILHIILSLILVLVLILSCSVYIQLKPPESVALVALRMPYQMFSSYLTIGCMVGIALYFAVIMLKGLRPHTYSLVLAVGFLVCCVMGIAYSLRIASAKVTTSGMTYTAEQKSNVRYETKQEDLRELTCMAQCTVTTPLESLNANCCVVFLNYGGWSPQDEKTGGYLQELFVNAGYSYARLAGLGKEQGNISAIVSDVKRGLRSLTEKNTMKKLFWLAARQEGRFHLSQRFF